MFAYSGLRFYIIVDKSEIIGNDGNKYYSPGTIPTLQVSFNANYF